MPFTLLESLSYPYKVRSSVMGASFFVCTSYTYLLRPFAVLRTVQGTTPRTRDCPTDWLILHMLLHIYDVRGVALAG